MLLKAIFWLYIAGAIIAFISLIIAGFNYMFSGGNASKTKKAIDQIKQAFIGLFILLGAYTILYTINPDLVVIPTNLFGAPPYLEQLNVPSDMNEEAAREILIEGYDYNEVEDNLVDQIKDDLRTRSDIAMDGDVIKDLDNQKLNPLILQVIDFAMNNWDKPSNCGQLIVGPGVAGHVKNTDVYGPNYQSCHDLGMAIDFEIPGIDEPWGQKSDTKIECQASLQSALKSTFDGAITILDESTHIHVQTADCS